MDKTPIEILADATALEPEYLEFANEVKIIRPSEALEAMKIFGKQCFEAAINLKACHDLSEMINGNYKMPDYETYIEKLEEKK